MCLWKKALFKSDVSLYDHIIKSNYQKLPKTLVDLIKKLEEYDKTGDWFNYDLVFDELEITSKTLYSRGYITSYDYKMILFKYGGLYD